MSERTGLAIGAPASSRHGTRVRDVLRELVVHRMSYALGLSWIVVYLAMTAHQGAFRPDPSLIRFGSISPQTSHLFGDLTAREVLDGQVWRTVTATFIHFSLLHLACNLICLVSFGRLMESWYGRAQFLAIYVAIGALGNGLSIAGRTLLGANPLVPSGGGSSVLFGLVALIAVAGWRKKTRFGDFLRREMTTKLLIFGVFMGVVGRGTLDNYGHAGGAIAGALLGLFHRSMVRMGRQSGASRGLGLAALGVLAACVFAQARSDRTEVSAQEESRLVILFHEDLRRATQQYQMLAALIRVGAEPRTDPSGIASLTGLEETLARLDRTVSGMPRVASDADYLTWRALARAAALRLPTSEEASRFEALSATLLRQAQERLARTLRIVPAGGR